MKERLFTLERTRQLTEDVYEMLLSGDMSDITAPGQFVDLELPGRFLRRPISICNWTKDALLLLVRVAGDGTREMVRSVPGTEFRTLSGLGNGFDVEACRGKKPSKIEDSIRRSQTLKSENIQVVDLDTLREMEDKPER